MENTSISMEEEYSFDEISSDTNFNGEERAGANIGTGNWDGLNGQVLARIFHFLRADMKSLVNVGLTCRLWRSVLHCYQNISRKVDLSSIALSCNDAVMWSMMVNFISTSFSMFSYCSYAFGFPIYLWSASRLIWVNGVIWFLTIVYSLILDMVSCHLL